MGSASPHPATRSKHSGPPAPGSAARLFGALGRAGKGEARPRVQGCGGGDLRTGVFGAGGVVGRLCLARAGLIPIFTSIFDSNLELHLS